MKTIQTRHALTGQILPPPPPPQQQPLSSTTIKLSIIPIQFDSKELSPTYGFRLCVHCDLDLGDMTLGQGQDTPLSHGQQSCEILFRSNLAVSSIGPDTDIWYVCNVTLTFEV